MIGREAYIYDHVRTPRGKGRTDGALHQVPPIEMASQTLRALQARNGFDSEHLDDVVLGCVSTLGEQGSDIGRIAALNAGFADSVAGLQVNRFCASGLEAVNIAVAKVALGEAEMAIGGGVESMSRVPLGSDRGAWPMDPSVAFKTYYTPQGIGADLIATKFGFTRSDVDQYAVLSQRRAQRALAQGRFESSVHPVEDIVGQVLLAEDELPRTQTSISSLALLQPSFDRIGRTAPGFDSLALLRYPEIERIEHVHHAGNSSAIADGAAAVLIASSQIGDRYGWQPRARIRAMASVGSEPLIMLTGPEAVTHKLLNQAGMTVQDIDLFEVNEAFASVVLRYIQALDLDPERINVNGGAISLGHPLGATGAIILGTALDELERSGQATALICLCVGAGMGTGMIIERV